ncbi:MAG: thiamine diphosphokinase [Coriobacteriales bacterium]|jgi:thiamine pyrophosphokinase|nr:thiamine diphosphokinase [Coriobacteriales bacterium]
MAAEALRASLAYRLQAMLDPGYTLLVAGSPVQVSRELVKGLAEAAALVVAVDSGGDLLHASGVCPGLVVGDLDSIDPVVLSRLCNSGVGSVLASPHKDETDLEMALAYLAARPVLSAQLVVTNVLGGRVDHELGAIGAMCRATDAQGRSPLVIQDDCAVVFLGAAPSRSTFCVGRHAPLGATVSCLALTDGATVTEKGMEWELDGVALRLLDARGVSNIVRSRDACVSVGQGIVAVFVNDA